MRSLNSDPLKCRTRSSTTAEYSAPASICRQRASTFATNFPGLLLRVSSSRVKDSLGNNFTSSQNIVNRHRIRNPATSAGSRAGCGPSPCSSRFASAASLAARSRVAFALRLAGSRAAGSVQTARSVARTSSRRRSSNSTRCDRRSGNTSVNGR